MLWTFLTGHFRNLLEKLVGLDINNEKYHYASNSKANRLRQFIKVESNYTFGKLLSAFCDYWLSKVHTGEIDYRNDENAYKECVRIADRLKQKSIVEHIDAISFLFGRDRTVVNRHINNIFKEGELNKEEVCAFFAHTTQHGAIKEKLRKTNLNISILMSLYL